MDLKDFDAVLGTNYAPTDAEAARLKSWCRFNRQEITSLSTEIDQLQAQLDNLREERSRLQQSVDAYSQLLTPMRQFIPEILARIFVLCLPTSRVPVMHPCEAPLLLGRVCSRWRTLAMSTPALWTGVHFPIPTTNCDQSLIDSRFEGLKDWITRAGVLPLQLSISDMHSSAARYIPRHSITSSDVSVQRTFDTIVPHSHRWSQIDIQLRPRHWRHLATLKPETLPALQSFSFAPFMDYSSRVTEQEDLETQEEIFGFLEGHVETMRSLSFVGLTATSWPKSLHRWPNLVSLHLSLLLDATNPNEAFLSMVSECPLLEECVVSLRAATEEEMTTMEADAISLPNLRSLIMKSQIRNSHSTASFLLNYISCPSLISLEVLTSEQFYGYTSPLRTMFTEESYEEHFQTIHNFLRRSGCSLKDFAVDAGNSFDAPPALFDCLLLCPELKRLLFVMRNSDSGRDYSPTSPVYGEVTPPLERIPPPPEHGHVTVLQRLTRTSDICPDLAEFYVWGGFDWNTAVVKEFIITRAQRGKLKRAHLLRELTSTDNKPWAAPRSYHDINWSDEELSRVKNLLGLDANIVVQVTTPNPSTLPWKGLRLKRLQSLFSWFYPPPDYDPRPGSTPETNL